MHEWERDAPWDRGDTEGGPADDVGTVHFRAAYRTPRERGVQEEVSRFSREGGEWRYLDGDVR